MNDKVKLRVLSAFILPGGEVAEVGTIVAVDPLVAVDISPSKGERLDPVRAKALIDAAVVGANTTALRIEKAGQARVPTLGWVGGGRR